VDIFVSNSKKLNPRTLSAASFFALLNF